MFRILLFILFFVFSTGCSIFGDKKYDQQLKSPCASVNGGPCEHIPINTWLGEIVYQV